MDASKVALGVATGVPMPGYHRSASWGGYESSRKSGLMNRVLDSPSAVSGAVVAAIMAGSLAAATGAASYDAHAGAGEPPIHVAVLDHGTARPDYGYPNLFVVATSAKDGQHAVHAAAGSEPTRGAVAVNAMLDEMRKLTVNPIVVHAYDPFVTDAQGRSHLDLDGLRRVAPVMAKHGVKVALAPYGVPSSAEGREFSSIMKANGIAVFAQTADRGMPMAPDIVTVHASVDAGGAQSRGNLEVQGERGEAVGRAAATAAYYGFEDPKLRGSQAIGFEMQDRLDKGTQVVAKSGAKIRYVVSMKAAPDVRIPAPAPDGQVAERKAPPRAAMAAFAAGHGMG